MIRTSAFVVALALAVASAAAAPTDPIVDVSTEHARIDLKSPDGGLPPLLGVQSVEVYHATHVLAEDPLGKGYTYNHHVDMAIWKGRYYLAWTNGLKDEDRYPSHEVFASSADGTHWDRPAELFPQGTSTSMRMFFFHAPNGRMLTTAGMRVSEKQLKEDSKGGLIVREILADGALGPVYTIIPSPNDLKAMEPQPDYTTSKDAGFVEACKQLLANHAYLEQQDFGVLLGKDNRMSTYKTYAGTKDEEDYGRALCFYYAKDGTLRGIGKLGYQVASTDGGKTWTDVPRALTLKTGDAKVWVQKTSDGRFALTHNPQPTGKNRWPLVILSGDDGISFKDMRLISGDFSFQRYAGEMRTVGVQYNRGVSIFANDGSRNDKDMLLAYSANKEDIWVSRIPVPLKLDETAPVNDHFDNGNPVDPSIVPNWITYTPKWSATQIVNSPAGGKALQIKDASPFDFVKVERVFPESKNPTATFTLLPVQGGTLEIDMRPAFGAARPVHLVLSPEGKLQAASGKSLVALGDFPAGQPVNVSIAVDCTAGTYTVKANDKTSAALNLVQPAASLTRLELRTGPLRAAPLRNTNKNVNDDKPVAAPATFLLSNVTIK